VLIDLASLLQTVCDEFADLGAPVASEGPGNLLIHADRDDIQRIIVNLIENALKYGGSAAVRLRSLPTDAIRIDVIDSGPGIPDGLKEAMLEPFARADTARNLNDQSSGFGLGLAIVRATAEAYGGRLELLDNQPSGLIARLTLPT
jgi:signal transduction histidine kinase